MQFRVGPWVYRVRITENRLYDENGAELAGLFVWRDREILISNAVPVRQRLDVLVHELRHAWREHFGAGAH
jgi:Zn-dependent peptidase ImmA (M78 family)